jgi:hypothetical protein
MMFCKPKTETVLQIASTFYREKLTLRATEVTHLFREGAYYI